MVPSGLSGHGFVPTTIPNPLVVHTGRLVQGSPTFARRRRQAWPACGSRGTSRRSLRLMGRATRQQGSFEKRSDVPFSRSSRTRVPHRRRRRPSADVTTSDQCSHRGPALPSGASLVPRANASAPLRRVVDLPRQLPPLQHGVSLRRSNGSGEQGARLAQQPGIKVGGGVEVGEPNVWHGIRRHPPVAARAQAERQHLWAVWRRVALPLRPEEAHEKRPQPSPQG